MVNALTDPVGFGIMVTTEMGDGGGGHWLVCMEWRPSGLSVCLLLLIFPCTINFRSSLLAPAHPSGPGKRAIKWLWWWWWLLIHHQTAEGAGVVPTLEPSSVILSKCQLMQPLPLFSAVLRRAWYKRVQKATSCSQPCAVFF